MDAEKIFVGRKAELERFKEVLKNPKGQAVLVVGHRGMGKTWLINKMASTAENHPELKCGWVRYEVTPTDSVDSTMALMMDNAFEAGQITEGSFDGTSRRLEQWRGLLNVINIGDLVMSLRRDPVKNTRDQFLERLALISKKMPKDSRAVFVIDPEKYMQKESDQSWAIVAKDLPDKIKFVFAQRTEDVLVGSDTFEALENVVCIPDRRLSVLDKKAVDELLELRAAEVGYTVTQLQKILGRYKGHPYAIGAALDLIEAGTKLEELPERPEPTEFAKVQWKKVCESEDGAIELFEAYAILEVGVPNDVVQAVSNLKSNKLKKLLADKYLMGLLREEGEGKRIYHAILADYILGQIGDAEKKGYHARAVGVYRAKLAKAEKEQVKPDELAARRLAEHVLAAEGEEAFIKTCAYETWIPLRILGLLDNAIDLAKRALDMVRKGSQEEAAVRCTMGLAYRVKGDLDEAEKMHLMALEIEKKTNHPEGIAREYGDLGLIYRRRGELDKAEEMHKKSLELAEQLGLQAVMASDYGNLGLVYQIRGDLDKAEEMHNRALEIDKKIGRLEGQAIRYGNLGTIYQKRGDLDKAEEMYLKSLEINKKVGRLEGQANQYGNLGSTYAQWGNMKKAKEYWEKALGLFKKIGMPREVEKVEGLIDELSNK